MVERVCRFCTSTKGHPVVDLGMQPPSNRFLGPDQLLQGEMFFPLQAWVCTECWLVQLQDFQSPAELFANDYVYFSSYSDTWRDHARRYSEAMRARYGIGAESLVIEVASNDGYLLEYFKLAGVPVLGIEPAANVAAVAVAERGIPTEVRFFGRETARDLVGRGKSADLIAANNVFAHVPDINDFVAGFKLLLKPRGTITIEFPHLLRTMQGNQFDTIYHEHFSYVSVLAADRIMAAHGLTIVDVEELPTHGGSVRLHVAHAEEGRARGPAVERVLAEERAAGLDSVAGYDAFKRRVEEVKRRLLAFLIAARDQGKRVVGYGAPAKGNTLLVYSGVREDLIDYVVDRSPHKQGKFLPGTHIPVYAPERIFETRPDYVLILPWNLRDEVTAMMAGIRDWGGQFVLPIPSVQVL